MLCRNSITGRSLAVWINIFFLFYQTQFELTAGANAQIWPRSLNSAVGIYLIVPDSGSNSGPRAFFLSLVYLVFVVILYIAQAV